jgi:hypothetical protein
MLYQLSYRPAAELHGFFLRKTSLDHVRESGPAQVMGTTRWEPRRLAQAVTQFLFQPDFETCTTITLD